MADNQHTNSIAKAQAHARSGQSLALGDTGDGHTGGREGQQQGMSNGPGDHATQAGAPQRQDQSHTSLDTTSTSGRARDEGPDEIVRTGAQRPKTEADATATSDIDPAERETL